jgi:hypothetical protein
MSETGQTETPAHRRGMSVLPPGADLSMTGHFAPEAVIAELSAFDPEQDEFSNPKFEALSGVADCSRFARCDVVLMGGEVRPIGH